MLRNKMEKKYKILTELPIGVEGCDKIYIKTNGVFLDAVFLYADKSDRPTKGTVHFSLLTSFRYTTEYSSHGFFEESYDSLCEIFDSDWVREFEERDLLRLTSPKRHFAVFFSDCGFLEVIAKDFEDLLKEEKNANSTSII